ncbi:class I SAM-dependent methyltransferase [Methylosinus sporium]|uniref:Class I SAM-dependent methyltransferase n=1 Tax=Methylosinus sporium TaxID=428 RepID=A0A2U1SVJ2_METSR|nr:class I SAM-dependent methyltransferase [Methylosinus sporium]PWB95616.1 class I SAM-dependent methyltransferase [Methylosinus sporium]
MSATALDERKVPPSDIPWPENELQSQQTCPVCGASERSALYRDLVDNVFFCAPGKWTSWRCSACGSAYLDPRPSPASIHLAYATYYTHGEAAPKADYADLSSFRKIRRRLVNGYTNWRFSTNEQPASRLGVLALSVARTQRDRLHQEYRHLPPRRRVGKVLDIGCGNGAFLRIAGSCGWETFGVDPDPEAVETCVRQGSNVRLGGAEQFCDESGSFDVITMNHVIEHLHDPIAVLKMCNRLLKPDGRLWLETPNIDSLGHRRYGRDWRGLEPPRHLVLFNSRSLTMALHDAGFARIADRGGAMSLASITKASEAIRRALPVGAGVELSVGQSLMVTKNEIAQRIVPSVREFLTFVAFKR